MKKAIAKLIDKLTFDSYSYYNFFKETQWWDHKRLNEYQLDCLKKLGGHWNYDIKNWDDFFQIPFITKKELRNFKPNVSNKFHVHNTSGSTGYPLQIYLPYDNWGMKEGMFLRHWDWMGRKNEIVVRWLSGEPKFKFLDYWRNVKPFNFRKLDQSKLEWIIRNRPAFMHATVFTAREVVKELKSMDQVSVLKDTILWWTNENTEPHLAEMSKYFKDIYHGYGLAELTPIATQCEYKNLHIIMEMAVVEEIDGEIVVTNPINDIMPIIRYKTGDKGKIKRSDCPCGRQLDILYDLSGKGVDYYEGKEFKQPIDWLVVSPISKKYIEHIDTWRAIVNVSDKTLELKVIWRSNQKKSSLNWYRNWLSEEIGLKLKIIDIDFDFPDKQLLRIKK